MRENYWDLLVCTGKGVLRFNGKNGSADGPFASGEPMGTPTGIRFGPNGNLYVGNVGPDDVLKIDGNSGKILGVAAKHADLKHPRQVAFTDNFLLVSSRATHRVLRFELESGKFIDVFTKVNPTYTSVNPKHATPITDDGLSQPFGLIWDPGHNLLVASFGTDSIRRYDGKTGVFIDTFACGHGLVQPRNLVYGPDDNLYVTSGNHRVLRFDGRTGAYIDTFVQPSSGGLHDPYGLEFGADGNLYVISGGTNSVLRYSGDTGAFLNVFVQPEYGGLEKATYAAFFGGLGGRYDPRGWEKLLNP